MSKRRQKPFTLEEQARMAKSGPRYRLIMRTVVGLYNQGNKQAALEYLERQRKWLAYYIQPKELPPTQFLFLEIITHWNG